MSTPRKLSHAESEVTRLKKLWRETWPEVERDYWREQFASARSRVKLRQELEEKYGLKLLYDCQLARFCRWVDEEDAWKQEEEEARADLAELEAQGLAGEQLREKLLERMKARAWRKGDFKLGAVAIRLDLKAERIAIHQRRLELEVRKTDALERSVNEDMQPGGLTPEVLDKIEREHLRLM